MQITSIEALEALYDATPSDAAMRKVASALTPMYRKWIMASRFCILTTVGPDGTDGSPRGDVGPVVTELDPQTLALPDWRGGFVESAGFARENYRYCLNFRENV